MKEYLRHYFNPLHMYCRLREVGMNAARARKLCSAYEKVYCAIL